MDGRFSIGLDYGTNSVRAIIVDLADMRIGTDLESVMPKPALEER